MKTSKITISMICICGIKLSYATTNSTESQISKPTESAVMLTSDEQQALQIIAEQIKLNDYSGVLGTAPANTTVSAVGVVLEETPTGPELAALWTQTLSNGLYYEIRAVGQYNMRTQNPIYPDTPISSEDNPPGIEGVAKLGYNFHVVDGYDMTPYIRLQVSKDMALVYQDTQGNYIHSQSFSYMAGLKQTFILNSKISPYIDLYGGYTNINLDGVLQQEDGSNEYTTANVFQWTFYTEFGASYRITKHQALSPFFQYIYTITRPDNTASQPYTNGGFNVTSLTTATQTAGVKYSYAW